MSKYTEIINKYPWMFELMKDRRYPISYGFQCNDGWFDVLDECFKKFAEIDKNKEIIIFQVKEKFGGLRIYTHHIFKKTLIENLMYNISVIYNRLIRFILNLFDLRLYNMLWYYKTKKERMLRKIINETEMTASKICESCGQPGEIKSINKWRYCTCESCEEKILNEES